MPLSNLKPGSRIAGMLTLLLMPLSLSANAGADDGFSMKIMDAFSITGRGTVLTGQVASGSLAVGDTVCVPLQDDEIAARTVDGIEMFRKLLDRAEKGQIVGILVQVDNKLVTKGALLHSNCEAVDVSE
jgi:translation elongation factor EF-Tu-like GTPase